MSELIISVSGLRGVVGQALTPEVAMRFAAAYAAILPAGPVIIGRDGRGSGVMLRSAIVAGLMAAGRDCIDADVIATPTLGVLVTARGAAGAVQISASHNPPQYNGIKLFGRDGRVLSGDVGRTVSDRYRLGSFDHVAHDSLGELRTESDPHSDHLAKVLATVNGSAIADRRFRVLLDSNHGAGGVLGERLLKRLGCDVVLVGGDADGKFEHVPEPTAENLTGVCELVRRHRCDVGFCQDPDADRLALIDASGRYVGEEHTLALCVQRAMTDDATRGTIVINAATSGMSQRIASAAGQTTLRSAVGEANVADMMIRSGATYGGEGNGGPIDPRVGLVRDSFVGMAQVLDLMAATGRPLSQLSDDLPQLFIHKSKADVSADRLPDLFERLSRHHRDAESRSDDGLRLAWPDKWLLVRGSNTEPIVRFIAEAESAADAKRLCDDAAALLTDPLRSGA